MGKGTQTQRHETAIFEVHLQSTDFSSAQSLWAISTCNNPPLLLLCLSGRPDIKPQDLSVCLPPCLPFHLSVAKLTDQLFSFKIGHLKSRSKHLRNK